MSLWFLFDVFKDAITSDFNTYILPILKTHSTVFPVPSSVGSNDHDELISSTYLPKFMHAHSLVSSRAFQVDPYHGEWYLYKLHHTNNNVNL